MSELTSEQRAALETRDAAVALSAGAGCGKTFVLTERFLSHLEPGRQDRAASVGELVAITFTDRAAREMRDRVRSRLTERLLAADGAEAGHWLALLRDLESARISTIHSFCAGLLRGHAAEAGVDPRFRTLDQAESQTLLTEVADDTLRRLLSEREAAVMDLLVGFDLRTLREMVSAVLWRRRQIDFDFWLAQSPEDLLARWEAFQREEVVPAMLRELSDSPSAYALQQLFAEHAPSNVVMQSRRQALLDLLPRLGESTSPRSDLATLRAESRVERGGGKRAWSDEEVYSQVREACKALREDAAKAERLLDFNAAAARPAALAGLQALRVAWPLVQTYEQQKRELGFLDFDDLIGHARDLLLAPGADELRRGVSAGIHALLVDEFQDTDPVQVELVKALCGEDWRRGKLFFVGDFKQSIYRFRQAAPEVFRRLREETPTAGRLPLTLNFRSQKGVLDFVNALFCESFEEYEPLRSHRGQLTPTPCVEFLWAPDEEHLAADENRKLRRPREAEWIARRLRQLFDEGAEIVVDRDEGGDPQPRAVRPGDCALLFRALSDVAVYEEALRRASVEYYLVGGHAFYAQQEIFDLLNLLRSLVSFNDDVALAGVLRSPFFGLSDETLFWLAQHPGGLGRGLFAKTPREELDAPSRRRVRFAAETLQTLRADKDRMPIAALVQRALELTGYDATLLGEFLGERKLANLHKLIDQARSFDRSGIFALPDYIAQLSEFVARQPDEALAATQPEDENVVRLMTVHQAKGLEFPLVVVPDLERREHGLTKPLVFDPRLGPLTRQPERSEGATGLDLYRKAESAEDAAERTRLFYVACTRAADYLILSSGVTHVGDAKGRWTRLLSERFDLETGELHEEVSRRLPPGYDVPHVRVTSTAPPEPVSSAGPKRSLKRAIDGIGRGAASGEAAKSAVPPKSVAPVPLDAEARREFSFSRLSGALLQPTPEPDEADEDAPLAGRSGLLETGEEVAGAETGGPWVDPTGLGTLVHAVLEEIDLTDPEAAAPLVGRFAATHLPDDPHGAELAGDMIRRFLASPRAAELNRAQRVHRELEFLLAWPPGAATADGRYLRGFIDALYQDSDGGWRLLDYKTNRVTAEDLEATAANYAMQMLVYALAAERALGQPPVSMTLYFLRPGLEHTFRWDENSRRRVAQLVDAAITTFIEGELAA